MTNAFDIFLGAFLLGMLTKTAIDIAFIGSGRKSYSDLLRETKHLIEQHDGIVTTTDLSLKAEISPNRAAKFLKKLSQQLQAQIEVDDTGAIYYKFITAKVINTKLLNNSKLS